MTISWSNPDATATRPSIAISTVTPESCIISTNSSTITEMKRGSRTLVLPSKFRFLFVRLYDSSLESLAPCNENSCYQPTCFVRTYNVQCDPGHSYIYYCDPCALNKYNNNGRACLDCPVGKMTTTTGSIACVSCVPGYQNGTRSCIQCLSGNYCPGNGIAVRCPAGNQCPLGSSSASPCTGNTYAAEGAEKCTQCTNSAVANSAKSACISCTAGEKVDLISSSCQKCEPGTFSTAFSIGTSCTACSAGFYTSEAGSTSCKECKGKTNGITCDLQSNGAGQAPSTEVSGKSPKVDTVTLGIAIGIPVGVVSLVACIVGVVIALIVVKRIHTAKQPYKSYIRTNSTLVPQQEVLLSDSPIQISQMEQLANAE